MLQGFPRVSEGYQRFPKVPKGSQRLPKVTKGYQKLPKSVLLFFPFWLTTTISHPMAVYSANEIRTFFSEFLNTLDTKVHSKRSVWFGSGLDVLYQNLPTLTFARTDQADPTPTCGLHTTYLVLKSSMLQMLVFKSRQTQTRITHCITGRICLI